MWVILSQQPGVNLWTWLCFVVLLRPRCFDSWYSAFTQIFREESRCGREDTGRLGWWGSLEEMMGMSDLVGKNHPGLQWKEVLALTVLINQKKSHSLTVPTGKHIRLSFLNVRVGFETLHVSCGPGTASGAWRHKAVKLSAYLCVSRLRALLCWVQSSLLLLVLPSLLASMALLPGLPHNSEDNTQLTAEYFWPSREIALSFVLDFFF